VQEQLDYLIRVTSELAFEHETKKAIEKLSEAVRSLLKVELCTIFLHDAKTKELWTFVWQQVKDEIRIGDAEGIAGYVFQNREPLIIDDPYADPRFNPAVDKNTGFRTKGILALPLVTRSGKAIGVVEAINKRDSSAFSKEDLSLLQHLGMYINSFVENTMLYQKLQETQRAIVHKLSRASRFKDQETFNHTVRVGHFAAYIADALPVSTEWRELLLLAAPMHDIGKVGLPDAIIGKPGKLTEEEFEAIKQHALIGCEILAGGESELTDMAAIIALEHQEWWNGKGYPMGKSGEGIALEARIVAIADVFDALCSERPYKPAWPLDKAFQEIHDMSGTHFDPDLVDAFLRDREEVEFIMTRFADEVG